MKTRLKDRIVDAILILLFAAIVAGCAWLIFKTMTRWTIKGLGWN